MAKKRNWFKPLLVVVLISVAGAGTSCHSNAAGGELVLTGAADPGANAFMPPAASPPPSATQPAPTLQPQNNNDTAVATLPLPGDRDGLYGGTVNNADCDREKMITFFGANPAQAGAFVEALNSDPDLYWSGGHTLTVADIPRYLRELTPVLLRLDTRITNHGFDGTHFTTLQTVLQAGTAALVDAHGVPRVRGYSGSPLTRPITLAGAPKTVGTRWPGYRPGALAAVHPSTVTITIFVLVDVVTGQPFNRPAGTTGANDTPHPQVVPPPTPASPTASATPSAAKDPLSDIDGTYLFHPSPGVCTNGQTVSNRDITVTVTHQGNALTIGTFTGTLNADGSFSISFDETGYHETKRGVFSTENGQTVIHGHSEIVNVVTGLSCGSEYVATKQ